MNKKRNLWRYPCSNSNFRV